MITVFILFLFRVSQQKQEVDAMLFWYWSTVCDADPAPKQHWVTISCLLVGPILDQCWATVCDAGPTWIQYWTSVLGFCLSYICDLLHFEKHQQTLRSESTKLLHPGLRSKRNYGHSSFVVAAPRLWNKIPLQTREAKSVTIFRKKLKTHLFALDLPPYSEHPPTVIWWNPFLTMDLPTKYCF